MTEDAIADAAAKYRDGAQLRELATPFGISHMRMGKLLREHGVKLRGSTPTEAEVDQMVSDYRNGLSRKYSAERLGFNPDTVTTQLQRRGVLPPKVPHRT